MEKSKWNYFGLFRKFIKVGPNASGNSPRRPDTPYPSTPKKIYLMTFITLSLITVLVVSYSTSYSALSRITHSIYVKSHPRTELSRGNQSGEFIPEAKSKPNISLCHFTKTDPWASEIVKLVKKHDPINCTNGYLSLVYIDEASLSLRVNFTKIRVSPRADNFSHCRYQILTRGTNGPNQVLRGPWSKEFKDWIQINDTVEFVMTECYNQTGPISRAYLSRISWNDERDQKQFSTIYSKHVEKYAPKEKFNVLMIGIDGMSRGNFERSMPKTRDYLLGNLSAIELEKYNKVGLNTFPNLIALVTGHDEFYFLKNWTWKQPFDKISHHFLWHEYRNAGYRTGLDLEEKYVTAFHYQKRGWGKSPVDHYSRPLSVRLDDDKLMSAKHARHKVNHLCKGDRLGTTIHNDYMLQLSDRFLKARTPYLGFSFLTRLTHDNLNMASAGDDLYVDFFKHLNKTNALNNTIVFFYSDHGARYGSIRHTYTGVIESKSPMGLFIFPPWFESKYPDLITRFRTNAQRLVSAFDLYATFRDILYFQSPSKPDFDPDVKIGISLFQTFPEIRTCPDAGIPTEFCNCNSLTPKEVDPKVKLKIATAVVNTINEKLIPAKDCLKLKMSAVHSVLQLSNPKDRKKEIIKSTSILYQVSVETVPGKAVFEAVVEINDTEEKVRVIGSISRINMYKGQKDCVDNPHLRPFCYCE